MLWGLGSVIILTLAFMFIEAYVVIEIEEDRYFVFYITFPIILDIVGWIIYCCTYTAIFRMLNIFDNL